MRYSIKVYTLKIKQMLWIWPLTIPVSYVVTHN